MGCDIVGERERAAILWLTVSLPSQGRLLEYVDEVVVPRCAFELSILGCLGFMML